MKVIPHIILYLSLAVICYALAFAFDTKVAVGIFLLGGVFFELLFWKGILVGKPSENSPQV